MICAKYSNQHEEKHGITGSSKQQSIIITTTHEALHGTNCQNTHHHRRHPHHTRTVLAGKQRSATTREAARRHQDRERTREDLHTHHDEHYHQHPPQPHGMDHHPHTTVRTMIIKNKAMLSTTPARAHILDIIEAGIARVLPQRVMREALTYHKEEDKLIITNHEYDLKGKRVFVIGGGKASGLMGKTLEDIMGADRITAGVITSTEEHPTTKIRIVKASHPTPDERGVIGVQEMLRLKEDYDINEEDVVICLISGGGSALMPAPVTGVSLKDQQSMTTLLLECGAEIQEINVIRKHLSRTKGGQLGQHFSPATVISLILSDVIGNPLDIIASGPTAPDPSTFKEAMSIIEKYHLREKMPTSIITYLERGVRGEAPETPSSLEHCHNYIIGDNETALNAMKEQATKLGYKAHIITSQQKGDPVRAAHQRAREIMNGTYKEYDVLLLGGETTPTLPEKHGKGGRNQHYAATTITAMKDYEQAWVMASCGTDGVDYIEEAAGGIVDQETLNQAEAQGVKVQDYLERYDSYHLLKKLNSLIITGRTGTNVGDIMVYLLQREKT